MAPSDVAPGGAPQPTPHARIIERRYVIDHELGRGGMGRVFAAHDLRLGRSVAVKLLPPGAATQQQLGRFEQEARAAGALNHPNILNVHDFGLHNGEPYIVTELLEGQTLRERLGEAPPTPRDVVAMGVQLAGGLAAAHHKGIVHRDLKPENLFLTDDGRLKILDFGIAKLLPDVQEDGARRFHTDTGAAIGTPAYMSPEQVRGQPADARSDVFACGSVLHEMLAGTSPFDRPTTVETAYAVLHDAPAPLPPGPLARIVERCLEKDPGLRYANAAELLDNLNALVSGERVVASRRSRRRTTIIAAVMLAFAVVVGAVARKIVLSQSPRAASPNVVVVFPFTVRGTGQSAYLGEGMVDLLSTTLASSSTRAVDAHALLAHLSREGWSPDPERGRQVAVRFGARTFVLGTVVEVGSRLRIHASLYDVDVGSQVMREAKTEGESTKIFDLIDDISDQIRGASSSLRSRHAASPADRHLRLAAAPTSSPEALKAYLEGEDAYRRIHMPEARAAFARAVAADPSFALAHAKLGWTLTDMPGGDRERAVAEVKRAIELEAELPRRDQLLIAGQLAFLTGKHQDVERIAREILRSHPDDVEAQSLLLGFLTFWGQFRGLPFTEAAEAFERAMAFFPPGTDRSSLVQEYLIAGEFEKARIVIDREFTGGFNDESTRLWGRWTRALLAGDRGERHRILPEIRKVRPGGAGWRDFYRAAVLVPGGLEDAEVVARLQFERDPAKLHNVLAYFELVRGRLRAAREHRKAQQAIADNSEDRLELAGFSTLTPFAPIDAAQLHADRDALVAFVPGSDAHPVLRYQKLMMRGHLSASLGDIADAERAAGELEQAVIGAEGSTLGPDWAHAIRATMATKAGRLQDALAWLERIRAEVPLTLEPWWLSPWPPIRYARAELLFLLGRYDDAARWFLANQRFGGDEWIAPRMRRLGQIEERRGNKEKAVAYHSRFIELWKDCDPELRPQVEEAQARLAGLHGLSH